jgi:hypothetical protein
MDRAIRYPVRRMGDLSQGGRSVLVGKAWSVAWHFVVVEPKHAKVLTKLAITKETMA